MTSFYDIPLTVDYNLGSLVYTADNANQIGVPQGKRFARINLVHLEVTASFVGTATPAFFAVGHGVGQTDFLNVGIGIAGAGPATPNGYDASNSPTWPPAQGNILNTGYTVVQNFIDVVAWGITQLFWKTTAPTGGAPAGTAITQFSINWW